MNDYIKREVAVNILTDMHGLARADVLENAINDMKSAPAADVLQRSTVEESVYETLRILDAINGAGRLDYGDYCELHDAMCAIMDEEANR